MHVSISQGTSTRDEVHYIDSSTCTTKAFADKAVSAVVASHNVATDYDAPTDAVPAVPQLSDGGSEFPELDVAPASLCSMDSPGTVVDPPEVLTIDGSLAVRSGSETAASVADVDPEKTSPIGPGLVDSDNQLFASCLAGSSKHLSKPCDLPLQETVSNIPLLSPSAFSFQLKV